MNEKIELYAEPIPCSARPISFTESICVGCNRCVTACQSDIFLPNPEKGKPPLVMYPGECFYCGACVMECPREGAIHFQHPIMNRSKFVERRDSGYGK